MVDLVVFGFGGIGKYLAQIKTSRGVFMHVCVCLDSQNLWSLIGPNLSIGIMKHS